MTLPFWLKLVLGLLAVATAAFSLTKAILEYRSALGKAAGSASEEEVRFKVRITKEFVGCLNQHHALLRAKRGLIIRVDNNGDVTKKEGQKYLTVLAESYYPPLTSAKVSFRRYPADDWYREMLDRLLQEGTLHVRPNEVGGFLADYYESKGIVFSEVGLLYVAPDRRYMLIVSFNFREPDYNPDTAEHRSLFEQARYQIAQYVEEHPFLGDHDTPTGSY